MKADKYLLHNLASLKMHLAKEHQVLQISADLQGEDKWQAADAADIAPLYGEDHLPLMSPKAFLFAPREILYKFDGESFSPLLPDCKPRVLFGVQACDLIAISHQDIFFKDDVHYQVRRQQTLLVGIDCQAPCAQGFCPLMDAGPHVRQHSADLILSQLEVQGRPWLLIGATEKGKASIAGMSLASATEEHIIERTRLENQALSQFSDFSYINNSIEYINNVAVPGELWEELSVRCLACSGCTNVCPTCSCYSTYEQKDGDSDEVTTLRVWDSCLFEGFQREASGHNPSHLAAKRTERFWFHKFSDEYLPEFSRYGCVGCGRCEQTCSGSVGVHSVMKRIDQVCSN